MTAADDIRTVVARRVLLDALDALRAHRPALVVVGAQAVYLHTGSGDLAVAAYTFDGDLALDPTLLDDDPLLERAMSDAGFALVKRQDRTEPGTWVTSRRAGTESIVVPVDLIVPEAFAPSRGRRSVKVGAHSKLAVRRAHGLEAALVDNVVMGIAALDEADHRHIEARVAGPAALMVAKLHKLHDRTAPGQRANRARDKDAADVYRLMQTFPPESVAVTMAMLRDHPRAGPATNEAVDYLAQLFSAPRSLGTLMAASALQAVVAEARVRAIATAWARVALAALA
jgi:hypothetical protein